MAMSKKYYVALAKVLRQQWERANLMCKSPLELDRAYADGMTDTLLLVQNLVADLCQEDNGLFDRVRFEQACRGIKGL